MTIDRRSALALIALDALGARYLAAQEHSVAHPGFAPAPAPLPLKPQFFHPDEFALLDRMAELILPADEHSPGATEAGVARFIDFVLANSPSPDQQRWRAGIKAFEEFAVATESGKFVALKSDAQAGLLNAASAGTIPDHAREFFEAVRKETVFAYYTTEIGLLRDLGYRGNQALAAFPGCAIPLPGE